MASITRNMSEATFQIATGRPVRYSEGILRQCVSAGLLELDRGEYTPTAWGYEVSNEVAIDRVNLERARRANARAIARAMISRDGYDRYTTAELQTLGLNFS